MFIENCNIEHILIENDNLIALDYLSQDFENKIDFIYIDPPYNTHRKFLYNDSFSHDEWEIFLHQRLEKCKRLMSEKSVIFVSIDDNELYSLKKIMDNVFGEKNFISNMIWKSKSGGAFDTKYLRNEIEYILLYSKSINNIELNKGKVDLKGYNLKDKHYSIRGKYKLNKLDRKGLGYISSLDFPIILNNLTAYPGGEKNHLKKWRWRWNKDKVKWGIENDFIVIKTNKDGINQCYSKQYQNVNNEGEIIERKYPYSNIIPENIKAAEGKKELKKCIGDCDFLYPKPPSLIKHLLEIGSCKNSIVLDFFAGTRTTLQSVLLIRYQESPML